MDNPNGWVQLIGVVLGTGVTGVIVQAIAQRKKVDADKDDVFVKTANTQRQGLIDDVTRLTRERDEEHARANSLDWKVRDWWARADRFMIWARRQDARNAATGIDDPMPDLYPTAERE